VPPTATPVPGPPAGFKQHLDAASGVALWLPESWVVVEPSPEPPQGNPRTTILQSYPENKYVGGEPLRAGDTKCDLTIHPAEVGAITLVRQIGTNPAITVVSEREVVLESGQVGTRMEIESLGRSLSLVTEVNERAVVLTCFGEFGPFDEIAVTLRAGE
jgi:hypothetical protein